MTKYSNGRIYKLKNDIDNEIYIGSTIMKLSRRISKHRSVAKNNNNLKVYQHLNIIGWKHVKIVLIEKYPCADREELLKREDYWCDEMKPSLNINKPHRTKEYIKNYCKEYRKNNKAFVDGLNKKYYKKHRKDLMKKQKSYYDNNKQKYLITVKCECGCKITKVSLNRHKKTNKHKRKMNEL